MSSETFPAQVHKNAQRHYHKMLVLVTLSYVLMTKGQLLKGGLLFLECLPFIVSSSCSCHLLTPLTGAEYIRQENEWSLLFLGPLLCCGSGISLASPFPRKPPSWPLRSQTPRKTPSLLQPQPQLLLLLQNHPRNLPLIPRV